MFISLNEQDEVVTTLYASTLLNSTLFYANSWASA